MTRRRNFVPSQDEANEPIEPTFGRDDEHAEEGLEEETLVETFDEDEVFFEEEEPVRRRAAWFVPTLAVLAISAWSAFFLWVHHGDMLSGASAQQWSQWIATWSMPALLVIGLWLLAMRTSRREASRFNDVARMLSMESAQLETRLKVVNRELSLARDFIASQSRDLESLGRVAAERLSTNADRLHELIRDNGERVETLGTVSDNAVSNMEHLRDQLPVLSSAARDMSNQIGNAGNVAHSQIEAMVDGFDKLNQFGEAGERHVERIGQKVTATLSAFDAQVSALGESTQARFGKLLEVSERFRTELVDSEETALAAIQERADQLADALAARDAAQRESEDTALTAMRERLAVLTSEGEQLLADMGAGREEAVAAWETAVAALQSRMTDAIAEIARVDESSLHSARTRLAALSQEAAQVDDRIAGSLAAFDADMARRREDAIAAQDEEVAAFEQRLAGLDGRLIERRENYESLVAQLTERSEGLAHRVSAIDADIQRLAAQGTTTREELDDTAAVFSERLERSRALLDDSSSAIAGLTDDSVRLLEIIRSSADHSQGALSDAVGQAETRLQSFGEESRRLHDLIETASSHGQTLAEHLTVAQERGAASIGVLQSMEEHLLTVATESDRLAERTGRELREALDALSGANSEALQSLREDQREVLDEIAGRIAEQSRERVADAIRVNAAEAIAELEEAVAQTVERGRETTTALREELASVNDLAGSLEQRVAYARERAEEQVDSDFTKRMALITEALNSSSIDIAKAFDTEVSDTQWANYLRGDRGIFTRRAVRLLNRQEARSVIEVYGEDFEFRETVNRYIHDFEAMLREVLATRDGNAIAVTLLSSDMGKLYVALAQAIDRLRS
ncbi:ATPase [Aurantiacibacter aquimixticola]|uniref:ATPase n=1 Tax=Aurantiacibacter aquimixticola TaxID=1958945 RepID=A0A419RRY0_9SPHN|nr:ATPase [Aurantiacibacter aquimixticola]RJY08562.1 ATPase [Aurantiacibacter aquimixticola]